MWLLWHNLPDKWQLCIGVFFAVLALTLPIFLLARQSMRSSHSVPLTTREFLDARR
jgi:hypothetical protein